MINIPFVLDKGIHGGHFYDIYSRLLKDRVVFITGPITDEVANAVIAQLLFLEAENPESDIQLYINSPGGLVSSSLAIYDTIQYITPDVSTMCVGMAASMGSILLMAGKQGKRYALAHSEVMIHQPLGGYEGQASDIAIHAQNILKTREKLYDIIVKHTGQAKEKVAADTDRDNYLTAYEALNYGIIDKVIEQT